MNSMTFKPSCRLHGFTLIEMMIGLLIGLLVSAAAVGAFLGHSKAVYQQMSHNQASTDVSETYTVLSRLLLQAQSCADKDTAAITVTTATDKSATSIDLILPSGFSIWPNTTAPFDKNRVRIAWSSSGVNANQIRIANSSTAVGLDGAVATAFAGANSGNNTRFTGLYLNPDAGDCDHTDATLPIFTYRFSITGKSYAQANDTGVDGATMQGRILPRN